MKRNQTVRNCYFLILFPIKDERTDFPWKRRPNQNLKHITLQAKANFCLQYEFQTPTITTTDSNERKLTKHQTSDLK